MLQIADKTIFRFLAYLIINVENSFIKTKKYKNPKSDKAEFFLFLFIFLKFVFHLQYVAIC
jgi:hypothetical protein